MILKNQRYGKLYDAAEDIHILHRHIGDIWPQAPVEAMWHIDILGPLIKFNREHDFETRLHHSRDN